MGHVTTGQQTEPRLITPCAFSSCISTALTIEPAGSQGKAMGRHVTIKLTSKTTSESETDYPYDCHPIRCGTPRIH